MYKEDEFKPRPWDDYKDILAREALPYELKMLKKLRELLPEFNIRMHDNKKFTHDAVISKNGVDLVYLEFETALTINDWKDRLPSESRFPRGLSIPARKVRSKQFDVYLKTNKEITSFFCATFEYIRQYAKLQRNVKNSVNTDNSFFSIPWEHARKNTDGFVKDDFPLFAEMIRNIVRKKEKAYKKCGLEENGNGG